MSACVYIFSDQHLDLLGLSDVATPWSRAVDCFQMCAPKTRCKMEMSSRRHKCSFTSLQLALQSSAGAVAVQELLLDELVARSATGMLQEGRKTLLYKDVGECLPAA